MGMRNRSNISLQCVSNVCSSARFRHFLKYSQMGERFKSSEGILGQVLDVIILYESVIGRKSGPLR